MPEDALFCALRGYSGGLHEAGNCGCAGSEAKEGSAMHADAAIVSRHFEKRSIMAGSLLSEPQL
jgi:hypothetical protein